MTQRFDALTALNRFGLGARPGEAAQVDDPRGWLLDQLRGDPPPLEPPAGSGRPRRSPPRTDSGPDTDGNAAAIARRYRDALRTRDPDAVQAVAAEVRRHASGEVRTVLTRRADSDRPFAERWVAFWSNHLCVSAGGGLPVALLAGAYERDAIRPHVFGPFSTLVLEATRHPAMLFYLDNVRSIGPASPAGRLSGRRGRPGRGLNENHARELLELHTLGVDGGYTQEDVVELARILTGWSVAGSGPGAGEGDPIGFQFRAALHEPGERTVLGVRYPEGGEEQGVRVIRDLARHPSTARHLATRLVRHFVADDPPASAVDRVARTWRDTEGDLRQVAGALVELDEAWGPGARKFRTPQDWLTAALRAAGVREAHPALAAALHQLRHPVWAPPSPRGYGDTVGEWADPDGLMNRAELARSVADRLARSARPSDADIGRLGSVVPLPDDDPLPALLADDTVPAAERIALALAGPAFQWR